MVPIDGVITNADVVVVGNALKLAIAVPCCCALKNIVLAGPIGAVVVFGTTGIVVSPAFTWFAATNVCVCPLLSITLKVLPALITPLFQNGVTGMLLTLVFFGIVPFAVANAFWPFSPDVSPATVGVLGSVGDVAIPLIPVGLGRLLPVPLTPVVARVIFSHTPCHLSLLARNFPPKNT